MGFQSRTYSLSDEVVEAIERLREKYGSPNKGLKIILLPMSSMEPSPFLPEPVPVEEPLDSTPKDLKVEYDNE